MSETTLYQLVNAPFTFSFAGKEYNIKKANLEKAILYQQKMKELQNAGDPTPDLKLAAYCIYIVLSEVDNAITEQFVLQNTPADIDVLECLTTLGFMNPQRKELAKKMEQNLAKKLISDDFLQPSPKEQDGRPEK
jgi:hypothetical protein